MLQICSKVLPKLSPSFLNVVLKLSLSYVKELPKLSLSFLKVVRKLSDSCVNGFDLSHSCPEIVYKLPSCCSILVILVVQPSGRLVNSLDRIDGGLQLMGSRILWAPVRFGQGNPKCIVFATVSTQHGSSSGIY